jgi:hypothetical protein
MFLLSYDAACHVLVGFAARGARTDADYERTLAAVEKLDQDGKLTNKPIAFVLVVDAASERPPPKWRRRLAEQRKELSSPQVLMAIVSSSTLTRGVMTAMNWVSPPPAHVQMVNHATIEEAAAWIERLQGTPRATVQRMFEEARARLSTARLA